MRYNRKEKSYKPANLVYRYLYKIFVVNTYIVVALWKSSNCLWIRKFSVEKPALCEQTDFLKDKKVRDPDFGCKMSEFNISSL